MVELEIHLPYPTIVSLEYGNVERDEVMQKN